ncbi:heptaprenyl diphosphate synthase [Arthrobacter sp. ok909]|nr:heptaprenyl diphosphate synthase [Arthrobacter sp. ok909]
MLRSRLVLEIGTALNLGPCEQLVAAAAAVELLHVASLVHDDLIDGAEFRREVPAVHVAVGAGTSILAGDLLLARGMNLAQQAGALAAAVWQSAFEQLTLGQLAESQLSLRSAEADFLGYISLKTAALFGASCQMGAIVAGSPLSSVEHARLFGWNFGMAFQLLDDLLDILGDPDALGKPVETDLPNGVYGVAALKTMAGERRRLEDALAARQFSAAYALLRSPATIRHSLSLIESYSDAAAEALRQVLGADGAEDLAVWAREYVRSALTDGTAEEYRSLLPNHWRGES